MNELQLHSLIEKQRKFFYSGATLNVDFRIEALKKLKNSIITHEEDINTALMEDLGKSSTESYMCETGIILSEIGYMLKNIRSLTRDKIVPTPLSQFHSKSLRKPSPYGVVLIMSPWNYPFMLSLVPLVAALAAGNTAVIKLSAYSPASSKLIKAIMEECFSAEYVTVITGGRSENTALLKEHFDYIFFTGNQMVGKEVMKNAAEHLTPVTLELGGKSPCIVEKSANLKLAARRIVFGKFINCGQTCVAPDYIYCDASIKDELIAELKKQICIQYGKDPLSNRNYGKIINLKHFDRLCSLIDDKVIYGGRFNSDTLRIEPTIIYNIDFEHPVMQQEIFGPLLPIICYDSIEQAVSKIQSIAHPLALYIFTDDKKTADAVLKNCGFGGGCINDTIIHIATSNMEFGGFGESGMGSYHGKAGFECFTHYKSIVDKKIFPDLSMRYQPYSKLKLKLIKLFLK